MDLGLTGKVAIITGGSEGIGKAAAHRMAAEGARAVIVARRPEVLEAAARDIEKSTGGVVLPSDEDWESDFSLKVWGAVRFIRAVIPEMRKVGGGRIINVTNLGGRTPGAASMPTSISRAAGIAITKGLSRDLAKDNILVNTVCIGLIKSGQHERRYARLKATDPDFTMEELYAQGVKARGVPLGRFGEAHEAGDVIAFLASERASYLTGIAINIDGGSSPVV
jgi:NAD(P)-dependent dehydrogenase (short-subunit alcohol dehydrogenase family)